MTKVMAEAISKMMERDAESAKADRRFLKRIRNAPNRGTGGAISWTREELYER